MEGLIKLSRHASRDRVERLSRIVMEVGIGQTIFEFKENKREYTITSTGVLMVWDYDNAEKVLLTAFLIDIDKAVAVYKNNGYDRVPMPLYRTVLLNMRVHKELYHI